MANVKTNTIHMRHNKKNLSYKYFQDKKKWICIIKINEIFLIAISYKHSLLTIGILRPKLIICSA